MSDRVYIVRIGDSLEGIAAQFGVSVEQLTWNPAETIPVETKNGIERLPFVGARVTIHAQGQLQEVTQVGMRGAGVRTAYVVLMEAIVAIRTAQDALAELAEMEPLIEVLAGEAVDALQPVYQDLWNTKTAGWLDGSPPKIKQQP